MTASLGLALALLGLSAAPALAAPQLEVELKHDVTPRHGDERVEYTATVRNTAATLPVNPEAGARLRCDGAQTPQAERQWFLAVPPNPKNANVYSFSFRWVRNGEAITGWEAGEAGSFYTVAPADAGKALQCVVKGTNLAGSGSFVAASQPVTVANPQPAVAPPIPNSVTDIARRPAIAGPLKAGTEETSGAQWAVGEELRCLAPVAGWSGAGVDEWKFEWLRDGEPAPGATSSPTATSSRYTLTAADVSAPAAPAVFQCMAIAINAGGAAIVESADRGTSAPAPAFEANGKPGFRPFLLPTVVPMVEPAGNSATGTTWLELELPAGAETFALEAKGEDWSCDGQPPVGAEHAKVLCASTRIVSPGAAFPAVSVAAGLGGDAPDLAVARASVFGGGAPAAVSAVDEFIFGAALPFGLEAFDAGVIDPEEHDYTQAGGHPFAAVATLVLNKKRKLVPASSAEVTKYQPIEHLKQAFTDIPRGFAGNVEAIPQLCSSVELVIPPARCPPGSMIGAIDLAFGEGTTGLVPIFAMEPEVGTPAQFAFADPLGNTYTLTVRLRPSEGYAVRIVSSPAAVLPLLEAKVRLCGFGAKQSGGGGVNSGSFQGCREADEKGAYSKPFMTYPTRCSGALPLTTIRLTSWEHPDPPRLAGESLDPPLTGCEKPKFEPDISLQPTSSQADSPTGMEVELTMPTEGFESAFVEDDPGKGEAVAEANLKQAKVTLPEGMSVNATAGQGLAACTSAQIGIDPQSGVPNEDPVTCPDASKIGTVEVDTPVLPDVLHGDVYVAKQSDNPFGSLLAIYMVIDSPENGILVKLAGRVDPDPQTGRLVVGFADNPEVPFSSVRLHFPQSPRSPLLNPPKCGTYSIETELSPWNAADPANPTAAEVVTDTSTFEVSSGPGGGPCPSGALEAKLSAGSLDPTAGATSPFVLRLSREDGSQRFRALNVQTPPGLTAYLKGIPYCPDSVLASISSAPGTGQGQLDSPSCPAASQIGTAAAGAGAGPNPLFVETGRVYLAGPYKGAPLSIAVVAPAVAGPIDLGNVVVRTAVFLDPETAQVSAVSDPVPTILHGILLDLREIRVALDRPGFTLNPTSCEPMSVGAEVKGESGAAAALANHYQVGDCGKLGFGPKLSIRLFGGTKRGANPRLRAVYQAGPGEANLERAAVTIPRSEFLDQSHIRTICTRVQFAADACPKGSAYGHAAAFTPLLDYPVKGPVYLRSSSHKLPDLVIAVRGPDYQPVEAVSIGRVDSIKGQIRVTLEGIPDVPLSKVVFTQQGGDNGLLVNSRDVCARTNRATVRLTAQNGKTHNFRPVVKNGRCAQQRKAKRAQQRHRRAAPR